jgi:hypothetical protein
MKKFQNYLVFAILVIAFSTGTAFGAAPMQDDPALAVYAADGTVSSLDLDGGSDTLIQYGDPDDGITGNRGDTDGSYIGSGCLGSIGGDPGLIIEDADLWWQLYELYLQFLTSTP